MADAEGAGLHWHVSSYSGGENCVSVAFTHEGVKVRDSKNPNGPILPFDGSAWEDFLKAVRGGLYDRPPQ